MKKFIKFNFIVLVLLSFGSTFAQQLPQFTQYMYNTISINPAYAGSRETLSLVGLHRSQWVGIEGGPTTQTFSIHSPLSNERVGLGLSFINDNLGYENFAYIYADFSYTIPVGAETKLAFGIKGGLTHYNLDSELLNDPSVINDQYFNDVADRWSPNVGAGLFLHTNKWYAGLSAPRILNTDWNKSQNGNVEYVSAERISYYFTGGYVFDISKSTKFKPAFMVKATNGAPLSYDLTANFLFNEKFWLGAAYRLNESAGAFGAIADFQVSKQLRIGYAYEHPISDIRPYSSGTHEVLLMYEFIKIKRVKSPRYF
ncbi:MAG: type IX secretion system membrane protein PorP/SprF [Bacteroidia bacterium]|nr:type IX secretion system membrane protein PorP/SprF [Bacteroidia bacterium]MBT8277741.1 type IX secretion system membrane protein PorP/SprF [Bacteroidia bacterium]NND25891.1 type IX secretion system membrane protein PorP/SprF [Flavobacteriaceae bacterium]NNK59408.1 type IX secretion system membrane protein PorP/SprF [Flavobacteriaceae bacterium]